MLDFMYTGSYEAGEEAGTNDDLVHALLENVKAKNSLTGDKAKINSTVAALFIHLEMNSIADFYDVYQLPERAFHKIQAILTTSWEQVAIWYPVFLEATSKKTADSKIHSLLVDISLPHFDELDGSVFGTDKTLDVPASFYSALLGKVKKSLGSTTEERNSGEVLKDVFRPSNCTFCTRFNNYSTMTFPAGTTRFMHDGKSFFVWHSETSTFKRTCRYCSHDYRPSESNQGTNWWGSMP